MSETTGRRPSRWAGLPPEERQRQRRELLIEAAIEALGTEGMAGTTVRSVCAGADLNPRYFYESFDELDELLLAVFDRLVTELTTALGDAARDAADDDEAMRRSVAAAFDFVEADRRKGRILFIETYGHPVLAARRRAVGILLVDLIQADAGSSFGESGIPEVVVLGASVVVGGFSEVLANWLDDRIDLTREQAVATTTDMLIAVRESGRTFIPPD